MPKILNILLGLFTRNLRSNILIMALVAIWIGFGIATPTFWSADNVQNVLPQMAIIAIMACGMVFVIVTGGIDLSVGFGAGFVSVTQLRPCSGRGGWGCEARAEGARSAPDVLGLGRLGDAIVLVLMPPATAWTTFAHVRRFWSRRRR